MLVMPDDLRVMTLVLSSRPRQAGFDNGDIHLMIAEMQKRNGREDFKRSADRPVSSVFEIRMYPIQQIEKLFRVIIRELTTIRSCRLVTCGEV